MSLSFEKVLDIHNKKLDSLAKASDITDELVAKYVAEIQAIFDKPEDVNWIYDHGCFYTNICIGCFPSRHPDPDFEECFEDYITRICSPFDGYVDGLVHGRKSVKQYSTGCDITVIAGTHKYELKEKGMYPEYYGLRSQYVRIEFVPEYKCR